MTTDTKCRSWHQLGRRCGCGFLAIPARFYERNVKGEELSQGEAEGNYLAWLGSEEKPAYVNPPVMAELSHPDVPPENVPPSMSHPCETCGRGKDYTGRECYACRKARGRRG